MAYWVRSLDLRERQRGREIEREGEGERDGEGEGEIEKSLLYHPSSSSHCLLVTLNLDFNQHFSAGVADLLCSQNDSGKPFSSLPGGHDPASNPMSFVLCESHQSVQIYQKAPAMESHCPSSDRAGWTGSPRI